MAKKPPNSKPIPNFGRINVDPGIADKLDHAGKIAHALKDNKQFRQKRTAGKRKRLSNGAEARKQFGNRPRVRIGEDEFIQQLRGAERELDKAMHPFSKVQEVVRIKPKSTNEQYDNEWNHEAHTGVVGKPAIRRGRNDPMHYAYPFVPKKR
ncbi:MAG: hypothetical protein KAJ19_12315 [Gammaproteobacteria bacterium]|nr:hypothetical protein [Gammaproteobacteria bacterium]